MCISAKNIFCRPAGEKTVLYGVPQSSTEAYANDNLLRFGTLGDYKNEISDINNSDTDIGVNTGIDGEINIVDVVLMRDIIVSLG